MPTWARTVLVVLLSVVALLVVHLFALSVQDAVNCIHEIGVCK